MNTNTDTIGLSVLGALFALVPWGFIQAVYPVHYLPFMAVGASLPLLYKLFSGSPGGR